jgi:hypothetical protein
VKFTWTAAPGSTGYNLRLGTTQGANDLYSSGKITATSVTPKGLPTNGETIYTELITDYVVGFHLVQVSNSYTFTAATQAVLTSPANGSVLTGAKVTFTWNAGTGATSYNLRIGTLVGANNLYGSGPITLLSATPTNLPTNGETLYVQLCTNFGSSQVCTNYVYTAAP